MRKAAAKRIEILRDIATQALDWWEHSIDIDGTWVPYRSRVSELRRRLDAQGCGFMSPAARDAMASFNETARKVNEAKKADAQGEAATVSEGLQRWWFADTHRRRPHSDLPGGRWYVIADESDERIAELEAALEAAAPYTIHMASDKAVAAKVYKALGRPVGTEADAQGGGD